jgi:AcrR family transcriptional regulator
MEILSVYPAGFYKGILTMRKPRADAQRNRGRIAETARAVFAEKGSSASMDEIARAAGVGPGTLYRHFPTRNALIEEVYHNETAQLAEAAVALAEGASPVDALGRWLKLFISYFATKQIIVGAFDSALNRRPDLADTCATQVGSAIRMLLDSAVANGDIRPDLEPFDLLRALVGMSNAAGPGWEASANRLVDVLIVGLSQRPPERQI